MIGVILLISVLYVALLLAVSFTKKDVMPPTMEKQPFVSIVIAARNEAKNIGPLLHSLDRQNYPQQQYEVLLVDDHSEDATIATAEALVQELGCQLKIVKSNGVGKKEAIQCGVKAAAGNIIASTDADCTLPENWLQCISANFQSNPELLFLAGPVVYEGTGWLARFQQYENLSVMEFTNFFFKVHCPIMSNGANLAYKKSLFQDPYVLHPEEPSGDDHFLLKKAQNLNKNGSKMVLHPSFAVTTKPPGTWSALVNQKRRWAGKWKYSIGALGVVVPGFLMLYYWSLFAALFFGVWFVFVFGFKLTIEAVLLFRASKKLGQYVNVFKFFVFSMIYPIYGVLIGIISSIGKFNWKGRSY